MGGGETGDQVRRAGAARRKDHARSAARTVVGIRGVRPGLLVAHQDVFDGRVVERVVDGHDRATGVTEHQRDALALERLEQNLGTFHSSLHFRYAFLHPV